MSLRSVRHTAAAALLVGVAYYVGANFGFILRFPPSTPSVLWPPNTILTATLLLTAPRRWWISLLAALPAHLVAELGVAWPISLVLALFATNCSEALIAAAGVRWFSDAPGRFDTLRRVTVFIVAAGLAAPFLSSFVDAAAVAVVHGEPYWLVWRTRFFSNVLTELMLGPAIIMAVTAGPAWLRSASRARRVEAALLAVALAIVGAWVFGVLIDRPGNIPGASVVVFLLPLILLMTVRFGPGGASLALLSTSLIAICASAYGRGPFAGLPAAASVQALQILLTVLAVPILCLAAVIVERRQATRALGEQLEALRASEVLKSAILASLSSSVAVLDRSGRIIDVNAVWTRDGGECAGPTPGRIEVGDNYLDVWREAARRATPHADEVAAGIKAVLGASRSGFTIDYSSHGGATERWFTMSVVPLDRLEGGAVVSCAEVTERKRAELDAQRSRQELAHFTRVSTMGELTASLAHELNQPLTAILTNAHAGLRFLDAVPPEPGELRAILSDIVDDDKRAGEVIQRVREFLSKGEPQRVPLDLNVLVKDVAKLLSSDAIIRNVTMTFDLARDPVVVYGDRVQLQQVILNLLLNAMEAMAECAGPDRSIIVRTETVGMLETVHMSVTDAGVGLGTGATEVVFEPFYTTKPAGMGMGLAIARSIIEAHGGVVWALNNPIGGATFHFAMPVRHVPT
jgi:two-component system, LuxR family, sensor kinase FixL